MSSRLSGVIEEHTQSPALMTSIADPGSFMCAHVECQHRMDQDGVEADRESHCAPSIGSFLTLSSLHRQRLYRQNLLELGEIHLNLR
jgi:hypothetical protein